MKKDRSYRKAKLPDNAKLAFEGVLFDTYQWEQVLYDGTKTKFERLVTPDIAKIVPVTEDGQIIITEDEQPARDVLIKFPGGYVDEGETPEESAKRELLEETGYSPESVDLLADIAPWNKVDYHRTYFVAKGCKKVQEAKVQAGERITMRLVSFDEMLQLLADGKIDDIQMQVLALQALLYPDKMTELRTKFLPS